MTARNHHYVPQVYLKGFVRHADKPRLLTFDLKGRKTFLTHPKNVAVERDFNLIDVPGHAPDMLETVFSKLETQLADALTRTAAAEDFQTEDDFLLILNLVGLMALRNPRHREAVRKIMEDIMTRIMQLALATPERWEGEVKKMKAAGVFPSDMKSDYDGMKTFIDKGQYKIKISNEFQIALELSSFQAVMPHLALRKWQVLKAPKESHGFVTSDHPVCLMWTDPATRTQFHGPGFGLRKTMVLVPLSNRLGLIGTFEGRQEGVDVAERNIAAFNGAAITYAERQVYARDGEFHYFCEPAEKPRRGMSLRNDVRFPREPDNED